MINVSAGRSDVALTGTGLWALVEEAKGMLVPDSVRSHSTRPSLRHPAPARRRAAIQSCHTCTLSARTPLLVSRSVSQRWTQPKRTPFLMTHSELGSQIALRPHLKHFGYALSSVTDCTVRGK